MTELDAKSLQEELEHYRSERDKVRTIVGQIGGKGMAKRDKVLNIIFVVLVVCLFLLDLIQYFPGMPQVLPARTFLELAVLLVSIKIIWMIHQQARVEHFQFWILNSIEFRLTELSRRMAALQQTADKLDEAAE